MSYLKLKPQVLFLPFRYRPLLSKFGKYSATDLIKAFMNKPIDNFHSWSILKIWFYFTSVYLSSCLQ